MTREPKTLLELEKIVAEQVGFDQKAIIVLKAEKQGEFVAVVTGRTAWLTKAAAQIEVDKICAKLRSTYKVKE